MIFMVGLTDDFFTFDNNDPQEKEKARIKEQMIQDIAKSMQIDQAKQKGIFSFAELVASSGKTVWYGEKEKKIMCADALFRLLDVKDYRYGNRKLFFESIIKELEFGSGLWINQNPSEYEFKGKRGNS